VPHGGAPSRSFPETAAGSKTENVPSFLFIFRAPLIFKIRNQEHFLFWVAPAEQCAADCQSVE
jgi:hypothetical protein